VEAIGKNNSYNPDKEVLIFWLRIIITQKKVKCSHLKLL